jgi:hypothetical protein
MGEKGKKNGKYNRYEGMVVCFHYFATKIKHIWNKLKEIYEYFYDINVMKLSTHKTRLVKRYIKMSNILVLDEIVVNN